MTDELQALCFLAGANSIFIGDVLLTTKNPQRDRDASLLDRLGINSGLRRGRPEPELKTAVYWWASSIGVAGAALTSQHPADATIRPAMVSQLGCSPSRTQASTATVPGTR